ncbi:SURF1 family cytochrome oxidase biogenesis protein [Microlunatus antarcticus]|uniref:SURF1-like protein n=1 Tax=Microlunatus antarcticus TaxID=53388 RepID=A0A7W5P801_9ACTN|nr:cytochrome oxidase assembly protein ShyY1 [Microlunatus antarcticus]
MQRLWVRWTLLTAFVLAFGTACAFLGNWQLDRLESRRERNVSTVRNEEQAVRPYTDVFTRTIVDADQWQRVSATGTFDADHQLLLRYRSSGDTEGYEVVTPLRTATGAVLVDRGIVSLANGAPIPTVAPAPPTGEVTVVGHVRRDEQGKRSAITPVDGAARLISSEAFGATLPYPVVDGYIGLITVDPPQTGGFAPVALPEISDGPHFWYAVQWFMFAGIGVAGIVVFIRGDLRERRTGHRKTPKAPKGPKPRDPAHPELTSSGV